jgi:hypothetical protein
MTDIVAFQEACEPAADTPDKRTALEGRLLAETARCKEAMDGAVSALEKMTVQGHSDQVHRIGRALRAAGSSSSGVPAQGPAQRSNADRSSFLLSESLAAAQLAVLGTKPEAQPRAVPSGPTSGEIASRVWSQLRENQAASRRAGFQRFLGEVTYYALPLDEGEKRPHREVILDEAFEATEAAFPWALLPVAESAIEDVKSLLEGCSDPAAASATVSMAAEDPASPIGRLVREAASQIERRVVAAVASAKGRAAALDSALALTEGTDGADPDLRQARIKRMVDRSPPTLIESLYVANRRALAESASAETISADLILAESVCQYALLETLSAYGLIRIGDPDAVARTVARSTRPS